MEEKNSKISDNGELQLPKEITSMRMRKKSNRKDIVSPYVLNESFKSNFMSVLFVGLLNALILIIVVAIMSSLNINATKSSMMSMFNSATQETTLKSGAIGYYINYDNSAEAFLSVDGPITSVQEQSEKGIEYAKSSTVRTLVSTVETTYNIAYSQASGTNDEKHESAKNTIASSVDSIVSLTSFTFEEKEQIREIIPLYLDQYYIYKIDNSNTTVNTYMRRMVETMTNYVSSELNSQLEVSQTNQQIVVSSFHTAFENILINGSESSATIASTVIQVLPFLATGEQQELLIDLSEKLNTAYLTDKEKYLANQDNYRSKVISDLVISSMISSFAEVAFYQTLPSFQVIYKTSDLGWPITYEETGETATNGTPIKKEVEVDHFDPSLFVRVQNGMEMQSNLLQKMRKEALTGVAYTPEEIIKAKEDAQEGLDMIEESVRSFMADFLVNRNFYVQNNQIIDGQVIEKAVNDIVEKSKEEVLKEINEEKGTSFTDINQITVQDYSMSGPEIVQTLYSYANSGIASYNSIRDYQQSLGKSEVDSILIGLVKGSVGVIDSLPSGVSDSLISVAENNIYGFFIGIVTFGIACVLLPLVYTIILANSLVAEKVETGSLAFTLSTPVKRSTFVNTEAVYLIITELFLSLLLFLGALIARTVGIAIGGQDLIASFSIHDLALYSLGQFLVMFAISGICFLSSCIFNKTRYVIALGGGVNIFFYICAIMGLFGMEAMPSLMRIPAMNFFNFLTIMSLNDAFSVYSGSNIFWFKYLGLLVIGVVTYFAGMRVFVKKDLPL